MNFEDFSAECENARIDLVTGVPDGYLVPLIQSVEKGPISYIPAAREEECLGIASGVSMAGKRALVMMQNAGFLNAIGCFSTLCMNYRVPMVIIVSHRGNLDDQNSYDTEKYRYYENFIKHAPVFSVSLKDRGKEPDLLLKCFERAEASGEPTLLNLDMASTQKGGAC